MLSIILNWFYVLFTTLAIGFGVAGFLRKYLKYQINRFDSLVMTGLIVTTVYAQTFSLFYKVGFGANVGLVLVSIISICFEWKTIVVTIRKWTAETSLIYKILVIAFFLMWAYFTSRGYMHYDSDLYHAQSIRWIETYGVVPGLGNLHERFAYNSSFFALSALFSFQFLLGTSMHAMNGFFAFVLTITCMPIIKGLTKEKINASFFARIGAIYYLTIITNEVVAPVSDIAVMLVVFFIVIKWLDALETQQNVSAFALLCVVGVYALTLKLTAGLILLLVIKPAYQLISQKRVKEIMIYLVTGLLIAIPWFLRTIVISGWLLYPFTALDIFNVDWKMDSYFINIDAMQIKTWGRALYNIGLIDTPFAEWFPNWFVSTLSRMEQLLIVGALMATFVAIIFALYNLIQKIYKKQSNKTDDDTSLVLLTLTASYLFWQLSAPLMRYGYAYVLLLVLVACGTVVLKINKGVIYKSVYVIAILFGIYKLIAVGQYVYDARLNDNYIWQQDYGTYDVTAYEIDGETFYYATYGDRTGYQFFPSAPTKAEIALRGDGIKDGFKRK